MKNTNKPVVNDDNLIVYCFCRVPFRLTCSPFLLGTTLKYHLQKEGTPLAVNMMNNICVDNVLIKAESAEQAVHAYQEAKAIFRRVSMNLRERNSNINEFLELPPVGEQSFVNTDKLKVLGLFWNKIKVVQLISGTDKYHLVMS